MARTQIPTYADFLRRFADQPGQSPREQLTDFDLDQLTALAGAERDEALEVLLEQLASFDGDPRIPRALAAMSAESAVPALQKACSGTTHGSVAAALALADLTGGKDPAIAASLLLALREAADPSVRLMAASDLGSFAALADPTTVRATLLAALDDEDELVRGAASKTLTTWAGLADYADNPSCRLYRLGALVLCPLRAVRTPAITEIREILDGRAAGKSPESMGLSALQVPESDAAQLFSASVFADAEETPALDMEALKKLTGEERLWADHLLFMLLGNGDPRGVDALVALGDPRSLPALQELAGNPDSPLSEAATKAVSRLSR